MSLKIWINPTLCLSVNRESSGRSQWDRHKELSKMTWTWTLFHLERHFLKLNRNLILRFKVVSETESGNIQERFRNSEKSRLWLSESKKVSPTSHPKRVAVQDIGAPKSHQTTSNSQPTSWFSKKDFRKANDFPLGKFQSRTIGKSLEVGWKGLKTKWWHKDCPRTKN